MTVWMRTIAITLWPRPDSNRHEGYPSGDFKSPVSAIPPRGPWACLLCPDAVASLRKPYQFRRVRQAATDLGSPYAFRLASPQLLRTSRRCVFSVA
jgi:hypothetical protein